MIEHEDENTFTIDQQTFRPVMVPKDGFSKMEHVIEFKNALRRQGVDPNDGVLHYCEKGNQYGMVFLPQARQMLPDDS